jgi:hypothetical protein
MDCFVVSIGFGTVTAGKVVELGFYLEKIVGRMDAKS